MPVVDAIATDYGDRVDFVAPAWKSDFARTEAQAVSTFVSGNVLWGLDEDEDIFEKYGVPYQPVTVLITADKRVAHAWAGLLPEDEIRSHLDDLISASG